MQLRAVSSTSLNRTSETERHFLANLIRGGLALLLAVLLVSQTATLGAAQSTPEASPMASPVAAGGIESAVAWLLSQQDASGGFIGFSGEPDAGITIDAILALVSAPSPDTAAIEAAAAFLFEHGLEYADAGPGQAAKLAIAATAVGQNPADFGLITMITGAIPAADSLDEGELAYCGFGPFDHALCVLALVAAGEDFDPGLIDTLVSSQIENGGWAFDGSSDPAMADSNTTAIVIQALIAAGVDASDPVVSNALAYLATVIDPEQGGFAYDANSGLIADANSTSVVIQALIAAGEDPSADEWGRASDALARFQNDSGAFRYQHEFPDDNLYATVQAIPALAGIPFPYTTR